MNVFHSSLFHISRNLLNGTVLFLVSIAVFVPLNPTLPTTGLDPSWAFAMNEAVAQGWIFGKEIVFTFGPYASIYTKMYHPATDHLMLFGSLFLSICYAQLLIFLTKKTSSLWSLGFALFISGFIYIQDALLFSYPLVLFMVTYCFSLHKDHPSKLIPQIGKVTADPNLKFLATRGMLVACFFPLGLLPLIKGSFLPVCIAEIILCSTLLWLSKHRILSVAAFVAPILSGAIFWTIAGQPFSALPEYFMNISFIISGYQEAMAITADNHEAFLYAFTSLVILCSIALHTENDSKVGNLTHKICLLLAIAFSLFVAFKAGFIRHDGHAAGISAPFIVIVALLLLTLRLNKKIFIPIFLLSIFTWGYIDEGQIGTSTKSISQNLKTNYYNFEKGLKMRVFSKRKLKKLFYKRLHEIHKELSIPNLVGSSDIYSYQQSFLLSSSNVFSFRPIFQSYSAYTPELAKFNENHIRSKNAPNNILFRVETIDNRLPSLDDGLSWPTLISDYVAEKFEHNLIYLKKIKQTKNEFIETEIYNNIHNINDVITLPKTTTHLYAEVELTQTLKGKIRSFLFKPTELCIVVHFLNGKKARYRLIANMAKSRFLLSPLIENTSDFYFLSKAMTDKTANKLVESIQIKGDKNHWNKSYRLKLKTITTGKTNAYGQYSS